MARIKSRIPSKEYDEGYDRIFGKRKHIPYDGVANKEQFEAEAAHAELAGYFEQQENK